MEVDFLVNMIILIAAFIATIVIAALYIYPSTTSLPTRDLPCRTIAIKEDFSHSKTVAALSPEALNIRDRYRSTVPNSDIVVVTIDTSLVCSIYYFDTFTFIRILAFPSIDVWLFRGRFCYYDKHL